MPKITKNEHKNGNNKESQHQQNTVKISVKMIFSENAGKKKQANRAQKNTKKVAKKTDISCTIVSSIFESKTYLKKPMKIIKK